MELKYSTSLPLKTATGIPWPWRIRISNVLLYLIWGLIIRNANKCAPSWPENNTKPACFCSWRLNTHVFSATNAPWTEHVDSLIPNQVVVLLRISQPGSMGTIGTKHLSSLTKCWEHFALEGSWFMLQIYEATFQLRCVRLGHNVKIMKPSSTLNEMNSTSSICLLLHRMDVHAAASANIAMMNLYQRPRNE